MEKELDWALLWRQLIERRTRGKARQPEDAWEGRAQAFNEHVRMRWDREDSSRSFLLDLLKAHPGSTVLDIGAGAGAWACMIAPHAAKVTALEPSSAMLAIMRENIRTAGAGNIEVVQGAWPGAAVEKHDFCLCSHAMYDSPDLPAFVRRMEELSRKACLLLLRAPEPDGVMAEIARRVWGHPYDSANFQVAYNCLLQMGIFANVLMEDARPWKTWSHASMDEAFLEVKERMGLKEDSRHDSNIKSILQRRLTLREDRLVWPSGVRSALVYWFTPTAPHP
ncbi:class I SAM-dependent methyltransferase [Holophaga foetida]|uniref:class I SAM-dependent methyltransferase n=1 Tax=Holophaga foetida TaxID=35839 RepID=UPI0002472F4B|nr:class I SAM-dependent methyltransferase [Holophaga foetida]